MRRAEQISGLAIISDENVSDDFIFANPKSKTLTA